ncbi:MAG: XRE family transcriptional regulator [Gordonibacter urolithinfaciens]
MGVGDKAVSKWERGGGCPDVSLLPALAEELGATVEALLAGSLSPDELQGGTMRRTAFRVCPSCENIITTTGDADVSCCGRKLGPLPVQAADDVHAVRVEDAEGDWYLTFDHPMEKAHSLGFAAVVGYDRLAVEKLYPEQGGEARLPHLPGGTLYTWCTEHGLMRHPAAHPRR